MQVDIFQAETRLDRYTVEKVLGRGGMAIVYRVRHNQLGTHHALKLLVLPTGPVQKRLLQEGRLQAKLRHPNIVSVTDVLIVDEAPGLVMEYVSGPSLREYLSSRRLTVEQVDELGRGILQGVAFAHEQGFVHRDLKPANILLAQEDGQVVPKVTDFGLAKIIRETDALKSTVETRTGAAMGTPAYMAPEQIRDSKSVDQRADVFSAGAVLYEMLCGDKAFSGGDTLLLFNAICDGVYRPIEELAPNAPQRMAGAIKAALEPDRDRRVTTVTELLALWKGEDPSLPQKEELSGPWSREDFEVLGQLGSGGDEVKGKGAGSATWTGESSIDAMDSGATNRTIGPLVESVLEQSLEQTSLQEEVLRAPELPVLPFGEQETVIYPPQKSWLPPALAVTGVLAITVLVLVISPILLVSTAQNTSPKEPENAITAPAAGDLGTSENEPPSAPEAPEVMPSVGHQNLPASQPAAPVKVAEPPSTPDAPAKVKISESDGADAKEGSETIEPVTEAVPAPSEPAIGGTLSVECLPRCIIIVDGAERGSTGWSGKVAVGPRQVEFKADGQDKSQRLVVFQDRTTRFCWDFATNDKCKK